MTEPTQLERALGDIVANLSRLTRRHALVGGLAVSVRAEVRFTRDVDIAVAVEDDRDAEALVHSLSTAGYRALATVEHEVTGRLATARLMSKEGVRVDLLFASSGIEHEIVGRARAVTLPLIGDVPVARAEELLATKVLSMTERRLQDRIDAQKLIELAPGLSLDDVRADLALITARGYHGDQDLVEKLGSLLDSGARGVENRGQ